MQNRQYKVYMHINKVNGKRYIGITRQEPKRRWQNGCGYDKTFFGNAIKKYGWSNFEHVIIASCLSKEDACNMERDLIKKYNSNNRDFGYNISKGGDTTDNFTVHYGEEHPNHQRVKMIDAETNEVIRIFGAQAEAARVMGISRKGITKACQGINRTYKGYIWEYADKEYKKPKHNGVGNYPHTKIQKPVKLIDVDGREYIFESQKKAAEFVGIKRNMVSQYLNGYCTDKTGRGWCYA